MIVLQEEQESPVLVLDYREEPKIDYEDNNIDEMDNEQVEREMVSQAQQSYDDDKENDDADQEDEVVALAPERPIQHDFFVKEEDSIPRFNNTNEQVEPLVRNNLDEAQSEESELDQKMLDAQASDQDFSDEEEKKKLDDEAFEEGSEDVNMISVSNPILFTEHVAVMGRVPLSKYRNILLLTNNFLLSFYQCSFCRTRMSLSS